MPNIRPEFVDPAAAALHPSDLGVTALQRAGAQQQRTSRITDEALTKTGQALGSGLASLGTGYEAYRAKEQEHTDAMAELDFQNKLTQSEIGSLTGVNSAGTPVTPDGQPMTDNPARNGSVTGIPEGSQVPTPTQFAANVSTVADNHQSFLGRLMDNLTGQGVSQKARDRMALQAQASQSRIALHAAAVSSEVAFNHAVATTDTSLNTIYAGAERGDVPVTTALAHADGVFQALSGTLSPVTAGKGSAVVEQARLKARANIVFSAALGEATRGNIDKAHAILNDPKYDAEIGGARDDMNAKIDGVVKEKNAMDEMQRKQTIQKQNDAAQAHTDQILQGIASGQSVPNIWTDPQFNGRPDLRDKAQKLINSMAKGDENVSKANSQNTLRDFISRSDLPDGDPHAVTRDEIDKAFANKQLTYQDYSRAVRNFKETAAPEEKDLAATRKEFIKSFSDTIDPSRVTTNDVTGAQTALGNQRIFAAQQDAMDHEKALKAEGKTPAQIKDILYNPNSPQYLGRPDNIGKFHTSLEDAKAFQEQQTKEVIDTLKSYAPGAASLSDPTTAKGGTPLEIASRYLGADEHRDHAVLTAFLNNSNQGRPLDPAQTAWCARFINSVLANSGLPGSGSDSALSFLKVGQAVDPAQAKPGDIIVFGRGGPGSGLGHVGLVKSVYGNTVEVLSGNHNNRVGIGNYDLHSALGVRRITQVGGGNNLPTPGVSGADNVTVALPPRPVKTTAEAMKLPPGTPIRLPNGQIGTVPSPDTFVHAPISR